MEGLNNVLDQGCVRHEEHPGGRGQEADGHEECRPLRYPCQVSQHSLLI